eukprot:Blabericola_migrator_1__3194@NODE_193_length_11571_cov_33_434805_g166_i0_p7_GENE_NODE_193_length_11571_cov_33_434805_g166_i0NODE_193_length_11571_cov_33_434805_g166_i0_p7_ORF_typecomplete_len295_score63_32RNase_PH/PF01138_21/6e14RNase_PH/PF01138_21/1_2e03RNase_PH_C/PF03725_15/3_3e07_NODE_193_length_11571_cov_33_434805_g166_i027873671
MEQLPFIKAALQDGVRASGRKQTERRPVSVEFGPQVGQCLVKFGTTVALSTVEAKVVMPSPDRPSEGIVQVYTQVSQLSQVESERMSGQPISTLIERLIKGSRVIEPESLCILSGRRVWQLKVNLNLIVHHGNAIDACSLAAIGSLIHFRKQEVVVKGTDIVVYSREDMEPTPLPLLHHPVMISTAVVDLATAESAEPNVIFLIDPDRREELAATTTLNIACNSAGDVCLINKAGGTLVSAELLLEHVELVKTQARELAQLLTEALNADAANFEQKRKNLHTRYADVPISLANE